MAVIKFSTQVSDVRGKSNGSVFAKNKGGNYFRSNKRPSATKTIKWGDRKKIIAQVSQMWRDLSIEQQEAWNNAAPNFPQINKVGDQMLISGYNLFCKVNGRVSTFGGELQTLPPAPQTIPVLEGIFLDHPDEYQWRPTKSLHHKIENQTGDVKNFRIRFNGATILDNDNIIILSNVFLDGLQLKNIPIGTWQEYLTFSTSTDIQVQVSISQMLSEEYAWKVDLNKEGVNIATLSGGLTEDKINKWTSFAVNLSFSPEFRLSAHFGNQRELNTTTFVDPTVNIGNLESVVQYIALLNAGVFAKICNFRVYSNFMTDYDIQKAKWGYILGNEQVLFDFADATNQGFKDQVWITENVYFDNSDVISYIADASNDVPMFPPLFTISNMDIDDARFRMNVYTSGAVSTGKIGAMSRRKLFTSNKTDLVFNDNFAEQYASVIPFTPADGQVRMWAQVIDGLTGLPSTPPLEVAQKRPKFKAGSELSNEVNQK